MTNSKTTKRALLSSTLALLMCVAMLIGTTFAWFTDSASTAVNTIQSGTLDVGLEMLENGEWVDAEGKTLNFKAADGRTDILWEPGCTYELPTLRIVNKGNLALRYQVFISGINGDAKLNEAIEWKNCARFADGTYTYPSDMVGNTLVEGVMYSDEIASDSDWMPASGTFKIIGHMKETAGNEYQGLSIEGIAITVVATQAQYENDSNGNTYDAGAEFPEVWHGEAPADLTLDAEGVYHITNAAQFIKYVQGVGGSTASAYDEATVVLDRDIDLNGFTITRTGEAYQFSGHFDGQNHTVSNYTIKRTDTETYTGLFGYLHNASVKNLTVENATVIGQAQAAAIVSSVSSGVVENCHAVNCDIFGEKKVGAVVAYMAGGEVKNCSATDCNVVATDTRADQAGAVLGYFNDVNGAVKSNLTATNVTVKTGAIIIANAEEFVDMMVNTQSGSSSFYAGKNIVLACDIDLGGATVTGFGSEGAIFDGNFNGLGHTVSNFVIDRADKEDYAGLFNYYSYGTLENLTVKNATVSGVCKVGALIGGVYDNATVKNCVVENCTVNANRKVGGAIGYGQHCTVSDCKVINTVINADIDDQAGEVVGYKNIEHGFVENGNTATGTSIN